MPVVPKTTNLTDLMRIKGRLVWVESPMLVQELDVYWTPQPIPGKTLAGVNIYRHITPRFKPTDPDVVKLNQSLVTIPLYRDKTADLTRKSEFYYLVTQVFTDTSEFPLDFPVNNEDASSNPGIKHKNFSPPRVFQEYRRRKSLILKWDAEIVQVMIQRTAGQRCEVCFDPKYEQSVRGNCPNCFGVGFEHGYELLPDVRCRVMAHQEVLKLVPSGLQFSANPKAWLIDFPIFRNGDVICRRNGLRYEVNQVDLTIHQNIITEQNFEIVALPSTSQVYAFDLPNLT